jgi:hypothetical protein
MNEESINLNQEVYEKLKKLGISEQLLFIFDVRIPHAFEILKEYNIKKADLVIIQALFGAIYDEIIALLEKNRGERQ